jgi:hypothetical protein
LSKLKPLNFPDLLCFREIFGDSMHWGGIAIIRLLNQHRRFDVIDFGYHLLRVYRSEPTPVQSTNPKQSNGTDGQIVSNCQ